MHYHTGEYTHEVYSRIPHANDAFAYVDEHPLPQPAINELRSVFVKHGAASSFGLSINHRHFDLRPTEQLVEYQNVSTPWTLPACLPMLRGKITAKNWAFMDGELYPYEFSYISSDAVSTAPDPVNMMTSEFVLDLRSTLERHRLEDRFGLAVLPPNALDDSQPTMLEFTAGNANVTVPMTPDIRQDIGVAAMYLFPCIDPLVDGDYRGPKMRYCVVCIRH